MNAEQKYVEDVTSITLSKNDNGTPLKTLLTSNHGFTPIGTNTNKFSGCFDGNNNCIYNMYINEYETKYLGFFGFVYSDFEEAYIKNIKIYGKINTTNSNQKVSGIVGYASNMDNCYTIENCDSYVNIKAKNVKGGLYAGGIAGVVYGNVINCNYYGEMSIERTEEQIADPMTIGGLVGFLSYSFGSINGDTCMDNCVNYGKIYIDDKSGILPVYSLNDLTVGGLTGYINENTAKNCTNNGEIKISTINCGINIGGITGETLGGDNPPKIEKCINKGNMNTSSTNKKINIGGIVGINAISENATLIECLNNG